MPPYNEPAPAPPASSARPTKGSARGGRAPRTAPSRPAAGGPLAGQGQPASQGTDGREQGVAGGDCGVLRYLQLTAVPSRPGGRAEEDPRAGVQVVLVVNGHEHEFDRLVEQQQQQQRARGRGQGRGQQGRAGEGRGGGREGSGGTGDGDGGRLAPVLRLCERLWELAGPGGPMHPTGAPASSAPSPSSSTPAVGTPSIDDWEADAETLACLLSPSQPSNPPSNLAASPSSSTSPPAAGHPLNPAPDVPLVHSVWLNFQPDACRNAILGGTWRHVAGPAAAWQDFGGVAACVGPGSFVQANYGAMQLVLKDIADMVGRRGCMACLIVASTRYGG